LINCFVECRGVGARDAVQWAHSNVLICQKFDQTSKYVKEVSIFKQQ